MSTEAQEECPFTCMVCGGSIAAGEPVHTALARGRAEDEEDPYDRQISWCDACDSRGAGLGRGMGRTATRVHRCGCGCVERAA